MECALRIMPSSICSLSKISPFHHHLHKNSRFLPKIAYEDHRNDAALFASSVSSNPRTVLCAVGDVHRRRSGLESLFCYDKPIPEEVMEKPVGLSLSEKDVGKNPRRLSCEAKGVILCPTCAGSGLYVDSILESQGIIVKVRCLGESPRDEDLGVSSFIMQAVGELGIPCVRNVEAGVTFELAYIQGCVGTGNTVCGMWEQGYI